MKSSVSISGTLIAALAITTLVGCGGGDYGSKPQNTQPPPSTGRSNQVSITGFAFTPLTVTIGTTVTWINDDSAPHTATSDASSAFAFDTGAIPGGGTSKGITFTQAGTFAYHCTYHSGMHGAITVR